MLLLQHSTEHTVCTYLRFGQHCSCYSRLLCSLEFVSSRRTISAILRAAHTTSATPIHCWHFTGGRSSSSATAVLCNRVESPQLPQQQSPNSDNLRRMQNQVRVGAGICLVSEHRSSWVGSHLLANSTHLALSVVANRCCYCCR